MVVAIIAIMATIVMGALNIARESAREARTKATIMKIHDVIMQKYDAFLTRRVPVDTTGMAPRVAAQVRLKAIRYLMMMEMPDRAADINTAAATAAPIDLGVGGAKLPWSSLAVLYGQKLAAQQPKANMLPAKCLYMIVTMGSPEAREMFSDSEIADVDGDGWPVFIDAWGNPIMFLRWAPAFTLEAGLSDIQTNNADTSHDPFDPMNTEQGAYKLIPLIYSPGRDRHYCIDVKGNFSYQQNPSPYASGAGAPGAETPGDGKTNMYYDNIHNHHIEAR